MSITFSIRKFSLFVYCWITFSLCFLLPFNVLLILLTLFQLWLFIYLFVTKCLHLFYFFFSLAFPVIFSGPCINRVQNMDPTPTASISPGNLLKVLINTQLSSDLQNQIHRVRPSTLYSNNTSRWFWRKFKIENHCSIIINSVVR